MWESVMEWIGRLSPVAINAWFAHQAYVSIQQHNYAKVAGWVIFILFCECDRIKNKLDFHTDRIDALGEKVRRYSDYPVFSRCRCATRRQPAEADPEVL